jgi:prolyl oligopeptidase
LFAAAVINYGVNNALRFELSGGAGAANSKELGTVKIEREFKALYEMDAYHHVRQGAKYPAVLLTQGINDSIVPAWQSAKMAARLQAASSSGKPVLLRVDYDAGHGGFGATQRQRNEVQSDTFAFLFQQLRAGK